MIDKPENTLLNGPNITLLYCSNIFDRFFDLEKYISKNDEGKIKYLESKTIHGNSKMRINRNFLIKIDLNTSSIEAKFYNVCWKTIRNFDDICEKNKKWLENR